MLFSARPRAFSLFVSCPQLTKISCLSTVNTLRRMTLWGLNPAAPLQRCRPVEARGYPAYPHHVWSSPASRAKSVQSVFVLPIERQGLIRVGQAADHIQAADSGEGDQRPGVHDDRFSHAA